ncbi:MAG: GDSL-type esterase/lipase family protein [Lawsonibacter sp.]|jgi:lysophospholipase L1-like esterase
MKILCFGDSNTFGYDPHSWLGERYEADSRWVDILAAETGWTVCNMGLNGREIPRSTPTLPADTDLLIFMLGTNDLLQGRNPEDAADRLEQFLSHLQLPSQQILLIAPPHLALGEWVPSQQLIHNSRIFAQYCQALAGRLGIRFANAGEWNVALSYDGVHFTKQGHRTFAAKLLEVLR